MPLPWPKISLTTEAVEAARYLAGTRAALSVEGTAVLLAPLYDPIRARLPGFGAALLVGGLALAGAQLRPGLPRPAYWGAHLLGAGARIVSTASASWSGPHPCNA